MLMLIRIILITYALSINVYAFLLIFFQKKQFEENTEKTVKDSKLFITGLLGGAIGIYVAMFVYSYRLQNLFLMIIIPILIVLNVYFLIMGFTGSLALIS